MSTHEPLHDPANLLAELDAIIREQEQLRQRASALRARYKAMQPQASRFDFYPAPAGERQFGSVNIEATASRLDYATRDSGVATWLDAARETAALVREYPQQERAAGQIERCESVYGPGASGFYGAGDCAEIRCGAAVPVSSEFARARTRELADRSRVDRGRSR
ncbi:hypothetical protein [Nocardia ninae]|nr:hypothetical protein [Nocardia ninae]